jgi:tRNA(Ile)-lysidine synthase
MASSRSSAADPLADAVARALAAHLTGPGRVAVALSGGRDSVALLAAVAALPAARAREPIAIHVHHGLSAR